MKSESTALSRDEKNHPKCLNESKFYHSKFPDIPSLSSTDLISRRIHHRRQREEEQEQEQDERKQISDILLVDVRTKPEREISIIPGSISLQEFHDLMKKKEQQEQEQDQKSYLQGEHGNNDVAIIQSSSPKLVTDNTTVVTYCTIGYRSGLEARHLKNKYSLSNVFNLDGIVSYTHASSSSSYFHEDNNDNNDNVLTPIKLIDPNSKEETNQVHTFGNTWNWVHSNYEPQAFHCLALLWQMARVGFLDMKRKIRVLFCSRMEKKSTAYSTFNTKDSRNQRESIITHTFDRFVK